MLSDKTLGIIGFVCGLLAILGTIAQVMTRPVTFEAEPSARCFTACETVLASEHRPAGWAMLRAEPCTCGLVLEVTP
jgi:hypothetical protein